MGAGPAAGAVSTADVDAPGGGLTAGRGPSADLDCAGGAGGAGCVGGNVTLPERSSIVLF